MNFWAFIESLESLIDTYHFGGLIKCLTLLKKKIKKNNEPDIE